MERGGQGVLWRRGRSGDHMVLHLGDLIGQIGRRGHVADPPARHCEGLGEGVQHHRALDAFVERMMRTAVVQEILVHLVGDYPQAVIVGDVAQRVERFPVEDAAGGVGRRIDHQPLGLRSDRSHDVIDVRHERLLGHAVWHRPGARQGCVRFIQHEAGLRDQHLVAWIEQRLVCGHGALRPRAGDDHVVGREVFAVPRHLGRDCGAQFVNALGRPVTVPALVGRLLERVGQLLRGLEVELAETKVDGVLGGHLEHRPYARRLDGPNAL